MLDLDVDLKESIEFLSGLGNGFGFGGLFASDGNLWNPIGANGSAGGFFAAFLKLSMLWFNRQQRYASRICYISNGIAQSAINKLTILTLGSGLEFATENKSKQKKIDEFVKINNWRARGVECFQRWLIDGETFYRFGFEGNKVRFIDPDLIYGTNNQEGGNYLDYTGLIYDDNDDEQIKGYMVHKRPYATFGESQFVDAKYIQHRSNSHWGQPRGFSWLLPILTDLFAADNLTLDLMAAAEVLSKYPLIRQWESQQAAVETFRSTQMQQTPYPVGQNGFPSIPGNPANLDAVPRRAIHDAPATMKYVVPEGLQTTGSIEVYKETLRKIAGQMCLPSGFFMGSGDERGAYAGELVANSYITRQIESLQKKWGDWELEALEKAGIDPDGVKIVAPKVSLVDKRSETELAKFLIQSRMASKETLDKTFDLDYAKECELIKQEEKEDENYNGLIDDQPDENNNGEGDKY